MSRLRVSPKVVVVVVAAVGTSVDLSSFVFMFCWSVSFQSPRGWSRRDLRNGFPQTRSPSFADVLGFSNATYLAPLDSKKS